MMRRVEVEVEVEVELELLAASGAVAGAADVSWVAC